MPCWPDLWREVLGLWRIYLLVLIFATIGLMLWAPGIKWFWVRVVLRIVGGAAGLFVLALMGLIASLASHDPKPEYRTVASPNGTHQVILKYQSGWLAMDTTRVSVTSKGCCQHLTVFEYDGSSDTSAVMLNWLDDSHLRIAYYSDPREYQRCVARIKDVSVTCVPLPWTSWSSTGR
jgi:hypothetical protein